MKKFTIAVLLIILQSCSWMNLKLGIPDDNLGEEIVETIIEAKIGLDVDLTPSTHEYTTHTLSPMPPMKPFGPSGPMEKL